MPARSATRYVPKKGRPTAQQVAAIERAILSCARRQFLDRGFDAVAMEGVAAEAGVSKGTLYGRYRSKSALLKAVIADLIESWSQDAAAHDIDTDDLRERLLHWAHIVASSALDKDVQALDILLSSTRDRIPEISRNYNEIGYSYAATLIARDIEEAAARDAIQVRDARSIAHFLICSVSGWVRQAVMAGEVAEEQAFEMADRFVDLLFASRQSW